MLYLLFVIVFVALSTVSGTPKPKPFSKDYMDFYHWDTIVKNLVHVNGTISGINLNTFNYTGLKQYKNDLSNFTYQVENANLDGIDFKQFRAFWVNVYNYLAVRLIFENSCAYDSFGDCQPIHSIKQIGSQQPSLLPAVWGLPYLRMRNHDNKTLSLEDIEGKLRAHVPEDVRIHAAIICASISCPNLRNRAYTFENIDAELADNTRNFLANEKKGVRKEGDAIRISAIFSFYPADFNNKTGKKANKTNSASVEAFLAEYAPQAIKDFLKSHPNPTIYYFTYNWDLNGSIEGLCTEDRICFPWWAFLTIGLSLLLVVICAYVIRKKSKRANYQIVN